MSGGDGAYNGDSIIQFAYYGLPFSKRQGKSRVDDAGGFLVIWLFPGNVDGDWWGERKGVVAGGDMV